MDDSQKYEADCQKIRKANHELLTDFESWLESSGLSEKTINNHNTTYNHDTVSILNLGFKTIAPKILAHTTCINRSVRTR